MKYIEDLWFTYHSNNYTYYFSYFIDGWIIQVYPYYDLIMNNEQIPLFEVFWTVGLKENDIDRIVELCIMFDDKFKNKQEEGEVNRIMVQRFDGNSWAVVTGKELDIIILHDKSLNKNERSM